MIFSFVGDAELVSFATEYRNLIKNGKKERNGSDRLQQTVQQPTLELDRQGNQGEEGKEGDVRRSRHLGSDTAAADDAAELAAYDAGRMSLAERAAQAVAAMSAKNRADVEARREAVKALGGNLQKLRQAMARQREYDKGTVDAIVRQARIMLEGGMLDGMTRGEVKKLLSLVA